MKQDQPGTRIKALAAGAIAFLQSCAPTFRIPLPPHTPAEQPYDHAALCPAPIAEAARKLASYSESRPALPEKGDTIVVYDIRTDAAFDAFFEGRREQAAAHYRTLFEDTVSMIGNAAKLRFLSVTDTAVLADAGPSPMELTVIISGTQDGTKVGKTDVNTITLFPITIALQEDYHPRLKEWTMMHELGHYLLDIARHAEEIFPEIKMTERGLAFTGTTATPLTTSLTARAPTAYSGEPALDLCALAERFGAREAAPTPWVEAPAQQAGPKQAVLHHGK